MSKKIIRFVVSVLLCEAAGGIGALFTTSQIPTWYAGLIKPSFNPPSAVFGPVWTGLFALMGIALFLVWQKDWQVVNPMLAKGRKAWNSWSERFWTGDLQKANILAVFGVQLGLNVLWSVIFFGLHQPGWAFFELVALWCSIVYVMVNFYRVSKPAMWLLLPYLIWVSFAGVLNYFIWVLN